LIVHEVAQAVEDFIQLYGQASVEAWIILLVALGFLLTWSLVRPLHAEK